MNIFNSIDKKSSKAIDLGNEYVKTSVEYFKLKVFQQVSKSFSLAIKLAILGGLLFIAIIFLSVAMVLWIGEEIGNYSIACLIVSLMIALIFAIVILFRKQIDKKVIRVLSKDFFD